MRIAFVAYDTKESCGGPFAWAPVFMEQMKERGATLHAIILTLGDLDRSEIAERCKAAGIHHSILDTRNAPTLDEQVEWILKEWRQSPSELFIANLVLPALIAGKWIRLAGGRSIGVLHSNPQHDPFYRDFVNVFLTHNSPYQLTGCVSVSEHIAKVVQKQDIQGTSLAVIPCGASSAKSRACFSLSPFRVMYCGRLEQEQKRIREVVHAMQLLTSTYGSVCCSIFGAGSEESWIRSTISGNERIAFRGKVSPDQIQQHMREHQAILLLSDYEGLPIALIEGMLTGLVPVCYDEPSGAREVISNDFNGMIVSDREESVVKAIGELQNPDNWQRLSKNALVTATSRYSYPVVMSNWWNYLSSLSRNASIELREVPSRVSLYGTLPDGAFRNYAPCRRNPEGQISRATLRWSQRLRNLAKRFLR